MSAEGNMLKKPRILIVEDNEDSRALLSLALESEDFEIFEAGDGVEALEFLDRHGDPDLVLLDLSLPNMDGSELAQKIRQRPGSKGIKLVVLSGHDDVQSRARSIGADAALKKPLGLAALHSAVKELMRNSVSK
jgi:CheY-like chemotaxis protein